MSAEQIKSEAGFVGYFDILGYQTFLENNSPEIAAQIILNTILRLEQDMPREMLTVLKEMGDLRELHPIVGKIKWLVFSDTIVLSLGLDEAALKPENREIHLLGFLMQCSYLWEKMFDRGLPLRGVLTTGSFSIQGTCFVGRPIVEAHKIATQIGFAGCVITPEVLKEGHVEDHIDDPENLFFFKYAVPYSGNHFENGHVLNVSLFRLIHGQDIRQTVHECFWKHGKDIKTGVQEKIEQTERYLRFLRMRYPLPPTNVPK